MLLVLLFVQRLVLQHLDTATRHDVTVRTLVKVIRIQYVSAKQKHILEHFGTDLDQSIIHGVVFLVTWRFRVRRQ